MQNQQSKTKRPAAIRSSGRVLRPRATPMRRCFRAWLRHENKIVRVVCTSDYRPCVTGGEPREYVKRITHKRWPRGFHLSGVEYSKTLTGWYAELPADQWCEMVTQNTKLKDPAR